MQVRKLTNRREFLRLTTLGPASAAVLAACAPSAPPTPTPASKPTEAPTATTPAAKPTEPAKPTAAPEPTEAAKPTAAPAATVAPTGEVVEIVCLQRNIPQDMDFFNALAKKFNERNPSIRVRIELTPDDFAQTRQARLAAGTAGDLARNATHYGLIGEALLGLFKPVDEYVKRDHYDLKQHFDAAIKGATVKGKLICLPWNAHPGWSAIYYQKAPFDEAGLKYPTGEWTYDDLTQAAVKLTTQKGGRPDRYGLWVAPFFEAVLTPVTAFGGWYQNEEGTKATYDDPRTVAGIQWNVDVYQKYKVCPPNPAFDSRVELWSSKRVAMVLSGIWENSYLGDATPKGVEWAVAPGPKGPSGTLGGYFGANVYPIWATSKHPDQAWEWHKYLASKEVGMACYDVNLEPGARPDVWNDPRLANDPKVKPHAEAIKIVKPMPVPANGRNGEVTAEVQKIMTTAWLGERKVPDAIAEMNKVAQKIIDMPPPGA